MRLLILGLVVTANRAAHAQREGTSAIWLDVDAVYSAISYSEPSTPVSESGRIAGVRGDVGFSLMQGLGITVGGDYSDGNMTYSGKTLTGATVNGLTSDNLRTTYGLVNVDLNYFILSGGMAHSEWYDHIPGAYRRREIFDYYPVIATLSRGIFYAKLEWDFWNGGSDKAYMSDTSSSASDVTFKQSGGSGYAIEIGVLVPTAIFYQNRIFLAYHHWDIGNSNSQNDGVQTLTAVENNTSLVQGGIGVSF